MNKCHNHTNHDKESFILILQNSEEDANPEIPLQETNGVYSIMSQIKERYAQHKTSSKTLHERNI